MNIPIAVDLTAVWVPDPYAAGILAAGDTTSISAQVIPAGGITPYTINSIEFVGIPPPVGMTLLKTTTDLTDDTIQIATTISTPDEEYSRTIRAVISDSSPTPQTINVDVQLSIEVGLNFDLTVSSLNPEFWYKMIAANTPIVNNGSNAAPNLVETGTPLYQRPTLLGGGQGGNSIFMDGVGEFFGASAGLGDPSLAATGTFMCLVRISSITDTFGTVFSHGNVGGGFNMRFHFESATGEFEFRWHNIGGSNDYRIHVDLPTALNDGLSHLIFVTQPGDTTGVVVNIDDADVPPINVTETLIGTATRDEWFASMAALTGVDRFGIGTVANAQGGDYEGFLQHVAHFTPVLSAANISLLNTKAFL